jgi:hypothetical protein
MHWTLLAALGCHGGDPTDTGTSSIVPPGDDDDSGPTTTDTGGGGGTFIDATYVAIVAKFGFDPDTQQAVPYAENGEGLSNPELDVILIDSDAALEGVTDENSCTVALKAAQPMPIAPWVAAHGAWVGFDWPADAEIVDRCRSYGLPGEFGGDAGAQVAKWTWGLGVGPLSDIVRKTLADTLPPAQWAALQPYAVGSAGLSPFFAAAYGGDGFSDQGYAVADQVDGNFEIVVGGTGDPIPLAAEDVPQDPGVARGYYEVDLGPFLGANLTQDPVSSR